MTTSTEISADAYESLTALLDERRRMVKRHERARRHPSRQKMTLAQKLESDRARKAELAELNCKIKELTQETGDINA